MAEFGDHVTHCRNRLWNLAGGAYFTKKRHKSRTKHPNNLKFESQVEGGLLNAPPKAFPFSPTGGAVKAKSVYVFHKNDISGGSVPSRPTSGMSRDSSQHSKDSMCLGSRVHTQHVCTRILGSNIAFYYCELWYSVSAHLEHKSWNGYGLVYINGHKRGKD